jgi:hypothetical protein
MIGLITTTLRAVVNIAASTLINALILTGIQQLATPPEARAATPVQDTFLTLLPQSFTLVFLKTLGTALAGPIGAFAGYILALWLIYHHTWYRRIAPPVLVVMPAH